MQASQTPLFDARGIAMIASRDRCSMVKSGGAGHTLLRKVHDDDHPYCDLIPRPFFCDQAATTFGAIGTGLDELKELEAREKQRECLQKRRHH